MQNAARVGDATSHGGAIATGSGNVTTNNCAAALVSVSIAPCAIGHGAAPVVTGSGSVFINGQPAARVGDVTGCGAAIASGSGNVFIGG